MIITFLAYKLMADVTDVGAGAGLLDPRSRYSGDAQTLTPASIAYNVINHIALPAFGVAAVISFIYGGVVYMTAGGDPAKVERGRNIVLYTVMATVLFFASFAIYKYVVGNLPDS